MTIIKLDANHAELIKPLYVKKSYMGTNIDSFHAPMTHDFQSLLYEYFCSAYLSGLNNYHAHGLLEDGKIKAFIAFYEHSEEPSWYYTNCRSSGNTKHLKVLLDNVLAHNEANGRLKFYTLVNQKHANLLRKFHFSKDANERYDYIDEFMVPAKNRCYYNNAWELLYNRTLIPTDTIIRCTFLKQKYRIILPIGGNL